MSFLNSLGAAACVSVGATVGAGVGFYAHNKIEGKLSDTLDFSKPEEARAKVIKVLGYSLGGAAVGTLLGAYAHSAMTSSVAVPTIAIGIPTTTNVGTLPSVL